MAPPYCRTIEFDVAIRLELTLKVRHQIISHFHFLFQLSSLLYQPIQRLTQHTAIIQEVLLYTPSRHSDHTHLRKYIDSFWDTLASVNKDHKSKGHRKVEEKRIIKGLNCLVLRYIKGLYSDGYITECCGGKFDDRKLRRVILANGVMVCLKVKKDNQTEMKWHLQLNKIIIESYDQTSELELKLKINLNKIGKTQLNRSRFMTLKF